MEETATPPSAEKPKDTSTAAPPWKISKPNKPEEIQTPKRSVLSIIKWPIIIIFLLITTNTITAAYFLVRYKETPNITLPVIFQNITQTNPSTDEQLSDNNPQTGSQTINTPKTNSESLENLPNISNALGQANDAKRKSDLANIGVSINMYFIEYDLPADFPTTLTCIGTASNCYDLVSLLVPDFMQSMPMDPTSGNTNNTGYSIYFDESGIGQFVLKAQGEVDPDITIYR